MSARSQTETLPPRWGFLRLQAKGSCVRITRRTSPWCPMKKPPKDDEQWRLDALQRLGWAGLQGSADRERAVWVVADLLHKPMAWKSEPTSLETPGTGPPPFALSLPPEPPCPPPS